MSPAQESRRRLPRARRITRGAEIRHLFRRGKRSRTAHVDVFDSSSPADFARVGLVVPRYKRTIVERNRLKRRLREILRVEVLPALDGLGLSRDVLVRARPEAYGAGFRELNGELVEWVERASSRVASSS